MQPVCLLDDRGDTYIFARQVESRGGDHNTMDKLQGWYYVNNDIMMVQECFFLQLINIDDLKT